MVSKKYWEYNCYEDHQFGGCSSVHTGGLLTKQSVLHLLDLGNENVQEYDLKAFKHFTFDSFSSYMASFCI